MHAFQLRTFFRSFRLPGYSVESTLVPFGRHVMAEIRLWQAARRLSALEDRALADIGISRSQIEHATRHGREYEGCRHPRNT
ncbi:DUF1127 domain-containing protein [Ancylobacter oerskovii]|uniref:DUF1127 domain-containing protein n=1 Tax=Ancylobacter oerskovii TaxID=459519 RepID=A0ABW4Z260_9HYPH|nr:DUF1127 domain-containing protein [Ancylobacter oerskovii]